ncbi:RNA recognition motif domain-containing protein [Alteromonas sp. RKMC-009]|uniref:RNA recognition motif domain-containing protein n=1 Tax=Alteromonas sp. RKMC-009 TaxID=2267264 RepID=UPI000C57FFF9|nr:RNA-binding protein [Alteromonas sp. RKMC-009]AYA65649.1 RNA-binding protein [Alteromonas sp. RKMC-009]MBT80063.1 RNA-binding protein [Alteromonadaceae bacterium]
MKVGFIQCAVISAVFAIAGYLIVSSASLEASLPVTVAVSLLISGIVTPWLASLLSSSSTSSSVNADVTSDTSGETATLYVGNLPYKANEDAVKEYFKDYIEVQSVRLMKDRRTGKRKGYGFIEVITRDVDSAITELNDKVFLERTLKVRAAREKGETE